MNDPTTTPRRWLAPAIALLFLAGLIAPAVAAGPLDGSAPAATPAPNLLALKADGSIVSWLDAGSNRTTIHIQGIQPGAAGFNLADPYARFVGPDQSSTAAGFVDFTSLNLLRGTYTLLGPSAASAGAVLARFNLANFGTSDAQPFASLGNATASAHLASALASVCAKAPTQGTQVAKGLWVRGYGSSCALGLDGAPGCLLAVDAACTLATAWAWVAKVCPTGPVQCPSLQPQPENGCTLVCVIENVVADAMATLQPYVDAVMQYITATGSCTQPNPVQ